MEMESATTKNTNGTKPKFSCFSCVSWSLGVAAVAAAVVLAVRGGGGERNPVARLVSDMVRIPGEDFWMGKFEVTQAQWEAVMGENPSSDPGSDHPVENVSWDDCQAFLARLNDLPAARDSGLVFRLPTEREWEVACRAGATGSWCRLEDGTEIDASTVSSVAWFYEAMPHRSRFVQRLADLAEATIGRIVDLDLEKKTLFHQPVGRKLANAYGLHDMLGNVWEWTDWEGVGVPVFRGGSFFDVTADVCTAGFREWYLSDGCDWRLGFRLCASGRAGSAPAGAESQARGGEGSRAERGGDPATD